MWSWFTFWLLLHVLGVVVAFGPTFAFGLIAGYARKNPQWGIPSTAIIHLIERRLTLPIAVLVPAFGVALIVTADIDLFASEWLWISIVLYAIAFVFSLFVQTPVTEKMLDALKELPPGPPPAGASGPPAHIAALGRRLQFGGIFLSLMFLTMLVLMIWKPGDCRFNC